MNSSNLAESGVALLLIFGVIFLVISALGIAGIARARVRITASSMLGWFTVMAVILVILATIGNDILVAFR